MDIQASKLSGVALFQPRVFEDERGAFVKPFSKDFLEQNGFDSACEESFYSISKKDVLRGMHFQKSPHDMAKIVTVLSGVILDVVVDIRPDSATYGQYDSFTLSSSLKNVLYVPSGFAHGFLSLVDDTNVMYYQSKGYNAECDAGIHYDSFGFEWPVSLPLLSDRDKEHPRLSDFKAK